MDIMIEIRIKLANKQAFGVALILDCKSMDITNEHGVKLKIKKHWNGKYC